MKLGKLKSVVKSSFLFIGVTSIANWKAYTIAFGCGLTSVDSFAPHSHSLTLRLQWDGREDQRGKSHELR